MTEYDDNIKCGLCGCEIYNHPTISIPIGSPIGSCTCECGCPLNAKHVYWMGLGKKKGDAHEKSGIEKAGDLK